MAGGEQAGQQGGFLGPSPTGGGHVDSVASVATNDPLLSVSPTTGNVLVSQHLGATWGNVGSVRYFACDTTNGVDGPGRGFSDVSQAAAGANACKTIAFLLTLIPKLGYGRSFRAAIRSGNYASDTTIDLSGYTGYQRMLICATDTVASGGAVAFAGDTNDLTCAGMTTATGMNAAGYNPTAYAVAADGTPTITLQLAGGGAAGFGAVPARPYGCRLRFDNNTTTAALRNKTVSIIFVAGGNTLTLGLALAANPVVSDVCYIEMPNVTGPTSTLISRCGTLGFSLSIVGLKLGVVRADGGAFNLIGCEDSGKVMTGVNYIATRLSSNVPAGSATVGMGVRSDGTQTTGGSWTVFDSVETGAGLPTLIQEPDMLDWERSSGPGMVVYGGAHAIGNNVAESLGTNSSTNHGASCQLWGVITPGLVVGVMSAGLICYGGYQLGRIKFSSMGANPCARVNGSGLGVTVQGITGGVADGNTDVGLDLSPAAISGNTVGANGCAITVFSTSTATGTNGDVRLPNGQIVSWAALIATGLTDTQGNRFISATAPLGVVGKFAGISGSASSGTTTYFDDNSNGGSAAPLIYPTSQRLITRLRFAAPVGTGPHPPTATLIRYPGGTGAAVVTAMTVTLPASAPAGTNVEVSGAVLFSDGDGFDFKVTQPIASEGSAPFVGVLEGPC